VRRWSRSITVLGGLAFTVVLAMSSAQNWSTVYLHDSLGASPTLAALGFGAYSATMTLGRLVGDHLTTRFGPVNVFRIGTLLGSLGFGAGLLVGTPVAAIMGFGMLGAGLSITFPLLLSAAGNLDAEATADAVARVSAVGYFGSFVSPMLIGFLAGLFGLGGALTLPVLLCACVALGARFVAPAAYRRAGAAGDAQENALGSGD
jgi:MFS family permease